MAQTNGSPGFPGRFNSHRGRQDFFGGGLTGVVHSEVPAQRIAAHRPAEGLVELGEVDGCCQYETKQGSKAISIMQA